MWFSALKGPYLTLGQIDKTLPVDVSVEANKKIKRGIFVYVMGDVEGVPCDPRFALYTSAVAGKANAVPYIALMGVDDYQAGMAGNIGQAETVGNKVTDLAGDKKDFLAPHQIEGAQEFRGPRITAISCIQAGEYQTNAFDRSKSNLFYVGCPLTVNDEGMLTPFEDGKNIVGYCTAAPTPRWINDLGADNPANRITGGNDEVIEFASAWIPAASASPAPVIKHTVKFNADGGTPAPADQKVTDGEKATAPETMTKEGFTFGGWFKDAEKTQAFTFGTDTITADITLYAKWTAVMEGQSVKGAPAQAPKATAQAAGAAGAPANKGGAHAGQSK